MRDEHLVSNARQHIREAKTEPEEDRLKRLLDDYLTCDVLANGPLEDRNLVWRPRLKRAEGQLRRALK